MSRRIFLWSFMSHYKYLIVVIVGVAVVGFIDEDSFMKRVQLELEISDLKSSIKKYKEMNERTSKQLQSLDKDSTAIEKIARERYFMKADDEDIYVLSDDKSLVDQNKEDQQPEEEQINETVK